MPYFVYILYSDTLDRYYVGQTENVQARLDSHLSKISRYTARASDWKLVYQETFETRTDALKRERQIKKAKSRKYIEQLIHR